MTMQAFYTRLTHALEVYNPKLVHLAALTKVGPEQALALKSDLSWSSWPEITA